jgi:hypothetical protein
MREAMAAEVRAIGTVGGDDREAEVDGGYFGGYVKPANLRENREDRRLRQNQSGKRKVVVVIRERDGKTLPGVFRNERDAAAFIRRRVAIGTEIHADEAGSGMSFMAATRCTGSTTPRHTALMAHARTTRRASFARFAQEAAWREDHKREPNGAQVDWIVALAMANKPSVDFCGYWQRSRTG